MGANSLGGVNLTVIAQEALPVLQAKLAPIALFTTDFSNEVASKGSAVSTRVVTQQTAIDFNRSNGYATSDTTSSAYTVTLNKHKHFTMGFDDSEVGNASLEVLQRTFIVPAVNAIANAVQTDLLTLSTSSAFPFYYSASYVNFGAAGIFSGANKLDNSGSNAPRAAILGSNLYYDVVDDIKGVYSVDASALREGKVGKIGDVSVANSPTSLYAGVGLAGFIGGQDALLIAARLPGVPSVPGMQTETISGPNGFPVQLRQWYSADDGQWKISAVAIYGVLRGNTSSGFRIITTD